MAETKFTPEPWTIDDPYAGFTSIRGPDGELIFGLAAGAPDEMQPEEVCEANARLIEAAPKLYGLLAAIRFEGARIILGSLTVPITVEEWEAKRRSLLAQVREET